MTSYTIEVDARVRQLAQHLAAGPASMWSAHAGMMCGDDGSTASRLLLEEFGEVGPGPFARNGAGTFDVLAAMSLVCRWGTKLSAAALDHVRGIFTDGVLHRGNTENHWLMHYTGNLLACERWGDAPVWWNGLCPAAVRAEADRWLRGIIDRTARIGQHEYDSPQYHPWHVLPMALLADHAADPGLRDLAAKAATLYVADMALEYAQGGWAGGHAREGYRENTWTRSGHVSALQYIYFGGEEFDPLDHAHPLAGIAISCAWRPPALLARIALDGSRRPQVVKKTKAPRQIHRHAEREPRPVRKYTYLSRSFALGSTQVGIDPPAGPIDLVSWDLGWAGPKHSAKIVANHPYCSPRRFSAFLGDLPQTIERGIAAPKPYLQWPDRLFGASPYERMMQHEGAILILYRIPPGDERPYVNLYLPYTTTWTETGAGWLCSNVGDRFFVGLRPLGAYRWDIIREDDHIDGWLLRIDDVHAGLALEAVEARDQPGGFDGFVAGRRSAPVDVSGWPDPGVVRMHTTGGDELSLSWPAAGAAVARVNGTRIDEEYPLYEAASVREAALGSGRILFEHEGECLELDFGVDPASPLMPMRCIG